MNIIRKALKKYNSIPLPAKAGLWFTFCTILQKCMKLITIPIFTRLMTTEQFGQFSVYNTWLQTLTVITTFRLNYAVFNKGMSKYKADRDGYTSTMQSITFMINTAVLIVYLIFREQINALTELPTFIMLAIIAELFVTPAIDFWTIRKRYEYIYRPVVVRTLLMLVLNTVLGVAAVFIAEEKGYARILSCVLVNICFGSVLFAYNLKKGKKIFCKEYAKFAILFNLPLIVHYLSVYMLEHFDRIMIQKMEGATAVAIYSVAYNAGMVMKIVTQSINQTMVPWMYGKLEKGKLAEIDRMLFMAFAGVAVISLAFIACAPEIMYVLADEAYHEAVYVIPPVAMGLFFSFMYGMIANMEFFYDKTKFTTIISAGAALLNVVLNYFGILRFGYVAAAYTTLICYVALALGHYFYMTRSVKKMLNVQNVLNGSRLLVLSVGMVLMGVGMIVLYDKTAIRLSLVAVCILAAVWKRHRIMEFFRKLRSEGKSRAKTQS